MFEMDACTQNLETQEKKYFMFSYCKFLSLKLTMIFPVNMFHFDKMKAAVYWIQICKKYGVFF